MVARRLLIIIIVLLFAATLQAGMILRGSGGGTPVEKQSKTDGSGGFDAFDYSTREYWASDFVAASSYTLTSIKLALSSVGSPTGNITAYIYDDSSGYPGSLLGTSTNTIDSSTLTGSPVYKEWNFSGVSISNGVVYWLMIYKTYNESEYVNVQGEVATETGRIIRYGPTAACTEGGTDDSQANHYIYGY